MIDIASIGVSTVIDQNYRRKAQLCLSGLFVTVSIATVTWFIFPASQNVLAPFLLPAMFLLFTLSMGYYMFIFSCEEKSLVKNVLGMVEPAESVKRVHCQENIKSLLAEVRSTTKDRFRNVLVNLCFEDRSKAHKLALYVKEIDDIVSSIKNKDLLDHFDQFFTITEVSNKKNRSELMNLARAYKMISEEDPDKIQDFLATQTINHLNTTFNNQATKEITVTDPMHPLFGRTFPISSVSSKAHNGGNVFVTYRNYIILRIPFSATDLVSKQDFIISKLTLASLYEFVSLAKEYKLCHVNHIKCGRKCRKVSSQKF